MSTTAIVLAVLAAAGLVLLLWAIGRAVTAAGNRIPAAQRQDRHYLAGRLDDVQITDTLIGAPAGHRAFASDSRWHSNVAGTGSSRIRPPWLRMAMVHSSASCCTSASDRPIASDTCRPSSARSSSNTRSRRAALG